MVHQYQVTQCVLRDAHYWTTAAALFLFSMDGEFRCHWCFFARSPNEVPGTTAVSILCSKFIAVKTGLFL